MLDLTPDECQLVANALNALAQRDGLAQPQQYAMSTQIVAKIQGYLKERIAAAMAEAGPEDAEAADKADFGTGPQPADV